MTGAFKRLRAFVSLRFVKSACEGDCRCHAVPHVRDLLAVPDLFVYGASSDKARTNTSGAPYPTCCCSTEGLRGKK